MVKIGRENRQGRETQDIMRSFFSCRRCSTDVEIMAARATTVKKMGEPSWLINHLVGNGIEVFLTPYHLNRMKTGCSSLPHDRDLAQLAVAHTLAKGINATPADVFERSTYLSPTSVSPESGAAPRPETVDNLCGPVEVPFAISSPHMHIFRKSTPGPAECSSSSRSES